MCFFKNKQAIVTWCVMLFFTSQNLSATTSDTKWDSFLAKFTTAVKNKDLQAMLKNASNDWQDGGGLTVKQYFHNPSIKNNIEYNKYADKAWSSIKNELSNKVVSISRVEKRIGTLIFAYRNDTWFWQGFIIND